MSAASTVPKRSGPGVGCGAMAIGIITGSGTYALPGFEGEGPQPVATAGARRSSRAGASPAPTSCTSPATRPGHVRLSSLVTHRANIAALHAAGAKAVIAVTVCGAVDPTRRARLARVLRRPALPRQPARRTASCARSSTSRATRGAGTGSSRTRSRPGCAPRCSRAPPRRASRCATAAATATSTARASTPRRRSAGSRPAASPPCPRPPGRRPCCARSSSCPYALLGYATDYANGVQDEPTPVETLIEMMAASTETFAAVLARAVPRAEAAGLAPAGIVYRFSA